MPMPVGAAFALRRRKSGQIDHALDPEVKEFRKLEKYIQENLICTIEFSKKAIPPHGGMVEGMMVLEATEDIEHSGIFILMKGLPITDKKIKAQQHRGIIPLTEMRFPVLATSGGRDTMQIDAGSSESYPLELDIPEVLPPALLSSHGRLMYRVYVCIATAKKRHVVVGETLLKWKGFRHLENEEVKKELKIEQPVHSKRGMLGLGRRRSAMMEWKVAKGGYLPGEKVKVELWGECKDKEGLELDCKVELVQKVWYQVPSGIRSVQMWMKMKVNVLGSEGLGGLIEMGANEEESEDENKLVWEGNLQVPKGTSPTTRFDYMNSVSYAVRATIGVAGESRDSWVTAEVPLLLGTSKEVDEDDDSDGKGDEDIEEDEDDDFDIGSPTPSPKSPASPSQEQKGMNRPRSGSTGSPLGVCRSRSMHLLPDWVRPRAGSISSIGLLASSTMSVFRMPPSYSQLSSRRPTMETLPPGYSELEVHEVPSVVISQPTAEDTG